MNTVQRHTATIDGAPYVFVRYNGGPCEVYRRDNTGLEMFQGYLSNLSSPLYEAADAAYCAAKRRAYYMAIPRYRVPCATCGAEAGEGCRAVGQLQDNGYPMQTIHAARKRAAR